MAKKKESLITEELDWYETELKEAREYLTNIKLDKLSDRPVKKGTANGGVTEVMVTKEEIAEHKFRLLAALPKLINSVKETICKWLGITNEQIEEEIQQYF